MNRTKFYGLLVIVLAVMNIIMFAFFISTQKHGLQHEGPPRGARPTAERIIDLFEFDEGQVAEFKKSRDTHKNAMHEIHLDLREASENYYLLDASENIRDSVLSVISVLNENIYRANVLHFDEVRSICNADQIQQMDKFVKNLVAETKRPPIKKRRD